MLRHTEPAIRVAGLRKSYDGVVQALEDVNLEVQRGELLALLGPNGAGKTTLVEILEGHRRADAGELHVLGFDPGRRERAFRERIGVVLQEEGLEPEITAREAIELYGAAYPSPRPADEVLDLVGLGDRADARANTLSGGQRRRLDVALGICGDPELIFLDEPTTGFDPAARRNAWAIVKNLCGLGKTVLLTTHYMDEAQFLAHRVAVMAGGRIVAEGPPDQLGGRDAGMTVIRFRLPAGMSMAELPVPVRQDEQHVVIETREPTQILHALTAWAVAKGVELSGLTVATRSLEDAYLDLVGR